MSQKCTFTNIYNEREYKLFEYCPSLFRPLYNDMEKPALRRKLRFAMEYCQKGGYRVYYLEVSNNIVGYCVVSPGGRRLQCSTTKDIVIGPYFIDRKFRGNGYSKVLIDLSINHCAYQWESAYDWIRDDNVASKKASEACGFLPVGKMSVTKLFRRIVVSDNGNYIIYRKTK